MAQITYTNKEALNEIPSIADKNKCKASDMNEIKNVVNENETKILLSISSTAPSQCSTGDMYFNSTDNLIYTATGTNTWGATGVAPTINTLYIILSEQTLYTYNGSTLVRVGEGAGGETLEIGTILSFAGTTAPDNYMICDGSAISRTTYSQLFDIVGTTYGSGDGSTTFNLPNIKGRVLVGKDTSQTEFDTLGETGGSKELQEHSHNYTRAPLYGAEWSSAQNVLAQNTLTGPSVVATTNTAGTGDSGNLQPYIVVNYIIKVSQTTPVQAEVVNTQSNSTTDAYSCDYVNNLTEVLWTNTESPTTAFAGQTITLSESISNFTYYEVIYKYTISDYGICTQSTGKVPVNELARLIDVSGGFPNFRNVTALSGTSMTFADCKYYTAYLATTTNNYNSSCVPIQVLGYK